METPNDQDTPQKENTPSAIGISDSTPNPRAANYIGDNGYSPLSLAAFSTKEGLTNIVRAAMESRNINMDDPEILDAIREPVERMFSTLNGLTHHQYRDNRFLSSVNSRHFHRSLNSEAGSAATKVQSVKAEKLASSSPVDLVSDFIGQAIGAGRPVSQPLPASKFRVTFGAISPGDSIDLAIALYNKRTEVGMSTAGRIFGVDDAHILTTIADWCVQHIRDTSIKGWTATTVKSTLRICDLPILFSGCLAAQYTDGYPVSLNCLDHDCDYTTIGAIKEANLEASTKNFPHIRFEELGVYDSRIVSDSDYTLLNAPKGSVSVKDVLSAQERCVKEGDNKMSSFVCVSTARGLLKFNIEWPTLDLFEEETTRHINEVTYSVNSALTEVDTTSKESLKAQRKRFINSKLDQLALSGYSHMISSIVISVPESEDVVYEDREKINAILAQFTSSNEYTNKIITAIDKFKEDHIGSFTAITNWTCPKCGKHQHGGDTIIPDARIPFNVVRCFFDIGVLRLIQAGT